MTDIIDQAQAEHESNLQRVIDAHRKNAGKPSNGLCSECSEPIPPARLEAVPGCLYCVDCQAFAEGTFTPNPEPNSTSPPPKSLSPPPIEPEPSIPGRRHTYRHWSKAATSILVSVYPEHSWPLVQERLKTDLGLELSKAAIVNKARKMGLNVLNRSLNWLPEESNTLSEIYPTGGSAETQKTLLERHGSHRTWDQIKQRAKRMGIRSVPRTKQVGEAGIKARRQLVELRRAVAHKNARVQVKKLIVKKGGIQLAKEWLQDEISGLQHKLNILNEIADDD